MFAREIRIMLYALDIKKRKIEASFSGQRAVCPGCGSVVIGKCGEIIPHYWSHLSGPDCDPWYEPLTQWHIDWQKFLENYRQAEIEVTIAKRGSQHRADAVLPDGRIFELQHSGISTSEIKSREDFYGNKLVWIFDAIDAYNDERLELRETETYDKYTFRWRWPRKSIAYAARKVFLDLGGGKLFELEWMSKETPCGGKGKLHDSYTIKHSK